MCSDSNYSNWFIWLVLLVLIFFKGGSGNSISPADYFRLTNNNNSGSLLDNYFNL